MIDRMEWSRSVGTGFARPEVEFAPRVRELARPEVEFAP
ncbi:hypothetical protein SAMN05216225_10501, partial [Ornithinibacillus halophilus]